MRYVNSATELPTPIATLFQPIVESTDAGVSLHAYECLTRGPHGSDIEEALPLFAYVRERGLEGEMDCACATQALRSVGQGGQERIAINVHPQTLGERRDFVRLLIRQCVASNLDPSRLIIEIGEQAPASNDRAFRRAIGALRQHGVRIAIDDVGHGYANYKSILDCRPEYLKIDRYFVNSVAEDKGRQAVVRSIVDLAGYFGATVIAEGVERVEDEIALRRMDVTFFQGFLYGRPMRSVARAAAPAA